MSGTRTIGTKEWIQSSEALNISLVMPTMHIGSLELSTEQIPLTNEEDVQMSSNVAGEISQSSAPIEQLK
ncbi:MAG TPA: hypothetical protein VE135_18395 [Pyrinomonadaceae bacterium]|nr:hypothetical protein [Pyrinomonadaceae bacterium]